MCDEWMPAIKLPITLEQFHQLPRHPGYKYEFISGEVYLSPRPKFYHALLTLAAFDALAQPPANVSLELLQESHFHALRRVFAAAFSRQQPYASLPEDTRFEAACRALDKVREGGDGPLIRQASFVAVQEQKHAVGAILITLLPEQDPSDWDSYHWPEPPPEDCIARRLGRPHLTWIFVSPLNAGFGTGTALLAASVQALRAMGFKQLASTFMLGNDSSMLWHWRNGFQLQAYPTSRRRYDDLCKHKKKRANK